MYLGMSFASNALETVLIVATLIYIGWVVKLALEKD
jgi:hypothetical protein